MKELNKNESEWFDTVANYINSSDEDYVMAWWLGRMLNVKTRTVNYHLSKLVDKGFLSRERHSGGILYRAIENIE